MAGSISQVRFGLAVITISNLHLSCIELDLGLGLGGGDMGFPQFIISFFMAPLKK